MQRSLMALTLMVASDAWVRPALGLDLASADDDMALGQYLASECVSCHQASGHAAGGVPPIVGWPQDQFIAVMNAYRLKHRDNPIMQTIAGRLGDEDIRALALYFGSLKPKGGDD